MISRAADATIKGYYYQFDTAILKLLELENDNDFVVIEGIEDIDIQTLNELTTVQCKYLSKPRFINSAVREPITLMLDHFVNLATPNDLKYILYAHFESEVAGFEPLIDLEKLKAILTYTEKKVEKQYHVDKGISDKKLTSFISQFKLICGTEFLAQQKQVLDKLKEKFSCSDFMADSHFYNNALRIIIDKAIAKDINDRKITKADFISSIDCHKVLFNEWFIKVRSKKEYIQKCINDLKKLRALVASREKYIFIGRNIIQADNSAMPPVLFLENLINKYYKLRTALRNAKPLTIILDCDVNFLVDLKKGLISRDILFNDGFEELMFSASIFNRKPIVNTSNNGTKITNSSYVIKLISKHTFVTNFLAIQEPDVYINFTKDDTVEKFSNGQFFEFKYCENLEDVFKILG